MKDNKCILYDRDCIDCGECDMCELDPQKRCDNCMKCVIGDAHWRAISIQGITLQSNEESRAGD